jgi:hypothetical protein
MQADVRALAGSIGPRGTGTLEESAAADYVSGRLEALGIPFERVACRAVATQNAFPLIIDAVALLAVVVYPLGGAATRWIAAGLGLSTAPLLIHTIRNSTSLLRTLLRHVDSQSIIGKARPRGTSWRRVVILAHLDTNRVRLAWQSKMQRALVPLTLLTLGVLASIGVIYLIGALLDGPSWAWRLSLLPAAYVLGTVVTLAGEERGPYVPGANDNAASVAVALELAGRLKKQGLDQTEVWLAFTGAEETDHAGLRSLLAGYPDPLRQAYFIGLEGVGGGEIIYATRQGLLFLYHPERELQELAAMTCASHPDLRVRPAEITGTDEVGTLRRAGYRAICVAGRDPITGTLPHWHGLDDTVETVDALAMQTAADFVWEMLQAIDRKEPEPPCEPS